MIFAQKALKEEYESCHGWMKEYNSAIDDGIQGAHTNFHWDIEKIQFLYTRIDIPLDKMGMRNKILNEEIVNYDEEAKEDRESKGEKENSTFLMAFYFKQHFLAFLYFMLLFYFILLHFVSCFFCLCVFVYFSTLSSTLPD